jgi:hypothetical protein
MSTSPVKRMRSSPSSCVARSARRRVVPWCRRTSPMSVRCCAPPFSSPVVFASESAATISTCCVEAVSALAGGCRCCCAHAGRTASANTSASAGMSTSALVRSTMGPEAFTGAYVVLRVSHDCVLPTSRMPSNANAFGTAWPMSSRRERFELLSLRAPNGVSALTEGRGPLRVIPLWGKCSRGGSTWGAIRNTALRNTPHGVSSTVTRPVTRPSW